MTGAFSVKFVGLSVILLVGVRTIYDLWVILGDMSKPVVKQFSAKKSPYIKQSNLTAQCIVDFSYIP